MQAIDRNLIRLVLEQNLPGPVLNALRSISLSLNLPQLAKEFQEFIVGLGWKQVLGLPTPQPWSPMVWKYGRNWVTMTMKDNFIAIHFNDGTNQVLVEVYDAEDLVAPVSTVKEITAEVNNGQ